MASAETFKIGELNNSKLKKQMTFMGDAIQTQHKKIIVWQHQRRRITVHWGAPYMPNDPPALMQETESGEFVKKLSNLDECDLKGWHWASDQWKIVPLPGADASGWMYSTSARGKFGKQGRISVFRKRLLERSATQALFRQDTYQSDRVRNMVRRSTRALFHGAGPENSVLSFVVYETEQYKKSAWAIPDMQALHFTNVDSDACSFEDFTLHFEDDDYGDWGWAETWKIYRDDETDSDGWIYARTVDEFSTRTKAPSTTNEILKWRRRKWIRSAVFQPKGNRKNLVTATMNEQLASMLWHVYLCRQAATFSGKDNQFNVEKFNPRHPDFDHQAFFAEEGRTHSLHKFSERFSVLWFNSQDQFFNGERARRRVKISTAMGVHANLINGNYVRTKETLGPEGKHDVYRNRDVDKDSKVDHKVFLWFDEPHDMWIISTEVNGGKILAYCEGEEVVPFALDDNWVVLNDPHHFAPKSLVKNEDLPDHITAPGAEKFQRQKRLHVMSCDVMNVFEKYEAVHREKYDECWQSNEVVAQSFFLAKLIMKSLIQKASFRDSEDKYYSEKEAEEFVEGICDVALLYSHILAYGLTKMKAQGLMLVSCLLESIQLGDSNPHYGEYSPLGAIEFLHDKAAQYHTDFMQRAMFSPDVLHTCENLLNLLENLSDPDFQQETTAAENMLLEESMKSITDITDHLLSQYHDPDIEESTIINLIVCFRASKKLAAGKDFNQHDFNTHLGRRIHDSAFHYYAMLKKEFALEVDDLGFFKDYPGFAKTFPRFYNELTMLVERDVIYRSKRLFERGVFGEKYFAIGVVSLLEKFGGEVGFRMAAKDVCEPFTHFHLLLLQGVGYLIHQTNAVFEKLGDVEFYNPQNRDPNKLFPWQYEVVNPFMDEWVKKSLEKILSGFEKQVKDPSNFADRKDESFLYSPCVIPIFTILQFQVTEYFNLLNEFPSVACESDNKFFGGLHNCFITIGEWIKDTTFAIKSEKEFKRMFETEGWFRMEESSTFQESIKVPKKPMEQYIEDFNCNCCRLMTLDQMSTNLKGLTKKVIQSITNLDKPHELRMKMLQTARSFLDHMTSSHVEMQEWLSRMLAAVLIHVQSDDIMSKVYTTENKRESNLFGEYVEIFDRMDFVLEQAKERLDDERYILFGESLQIVFDEAMFHMLTHRESKRLFEDKDNQWLRADYREFRDFFIAQGIAHQDNRWHDVLELMELSTEDLKFKAENGRNTNDTPEPMSLVTASRAMNTTTPMFLVLAHRNDPEAKAFVKKNASKPHTTRPRGAPQLFPSVGHSTGGSIQIPRQSTQRSSTATTFPGKMARFSPPYRFTFIVHCCKDLLAVDRAGTSDPYVKIKCRDTEKTTPVIAKNLNPEWNFQFTCRIPEGFFEHPDQHLEVHLKVKDSNRFFRAKKIGSLTLRFKEGTGADEEWKRWLKPDGTEDTAGVHGRIKYSAFFTDLR